MKPQSKLFLALGIIIVSIILTILILRTIFLHALSSLQYYKSNREVNNICQLQNDRLKDVLPLPSPKEKERMLQGKDRESFLLWKDLFIKTNKVSEDYLNNHIRIESITNGDGFFISYYYIVDWAFISLGDKITNYLTVEEVDWALISLSDKIANENTINNIREPNKGIIENIITCEKAVKIFKTKFLTPFIITTYYTDLDYNGHIILFIEAESVFRRKCSIATINLRDGSFDNFNVSNDDCSFKEGNPPGM